MDKIDIAILASLQADSTRPVTDLAQEVNLSGPACWKRIQRLKRDGVVLREVALCDEAQLERATIVFVFIRAPNHNAQWLQSFRAAMAELPEISSAYRLSGEVDYLLHVYVKDIAGYDRFYQRLIRLVELTNVSSSFVMEKLKHSTAIPLAE